MAYSNMRTNVDNYFEKAKAVFHIFSRCKSIRWKVETQWTEIGMKKLPRLPSGMGYACARAYPYLRPCLGVPASTGADIPKQARKKTAPDAHQATERMCTFAPVFRDNVFLL